MTIIHGNALIGYLMDRMSISCFNSCIKDFSTSDLNTDEASCIDRCSIKYFDAYNTINQQIEQQLRLNRDLQNQSNQPAPYPK